MFGVTTVKFSPVSVWDISITYWPTPPVVPLTWLTILVPRARVGPEIICPVDNVPPVNVKTYIVVPVISQVPFNIDLFWDISTTYLPTPPVVPFIWDTIVVLTSTVGPANISPGAKLLSLIV